VPPKLHSLCCARRVCMLKVSPHPDYPPEEGRYIRGNDFSPAAVAIILNCEADKIPRELEDLVRAGVESGAALSGTVQTENIGFEKIVCNIVANPNIRFLIVGGPESPGHSTGEALKALLSNGIDEKKRIRGTKAPHPLLFNVPVESIERFRKQLTLVDLQFQADPDLIRKAVWSCFQESPVEFRGQSLFDPGAFPEPPLGGRITWRITQPWAEPADDREREALRKTQALMKKLQEMQEQKKRER
jgi:tetrahydromethanopterin S-methyltransferase subunit A